MARAGKSGLNGPNDANDAIEAGHQPNGGAAKSNQVPSPKLADSEGPTSVADKRSYPEKIAAIDQKLLELTENRAELLRRWGVESKANQRDVGIPPTIWEQLGNVDIALNELAPDSRIPRALAEHFLRTVSGVSYFSCAPAIQVAYLGPIYSYSYLASIKYFSESARLSPVSTIPAVFDEILREQASFGVVPIENSTDGRIVDTLNMFAKTPVKICGEVLLPIHHCLLGKCSREEIREVYSKPQALSQCRSWLREHLPEVRLVEIASTTAAARLAAEKQGAVAVASREAGIHFGLNIIAENIEDNAFNVTRFAVIGNHIHDKTDNDKTSLMFQIPHQSGALADAMQIFNRNKLNLTWIESFPIPGNRNEYLFFIELEGHQSDKSVSASISALAKQTIRLEVLGSYPKAIG